MKFQAERLNNAEEKRSWIAATLLPNRYALFQHLEIHYSLSTITHVNVKKKKKSGGIQTSSLLMPELLFLSNGAIIPIPALLCEHNCNLSLCLKNILTAINGK